MPYAELEKILKGTKKDSGPSNISAPQESVSKPNFTKLLEDLRKLQPPQIDPPPIGQPESVLENKIQPALGSLGVEQERQLTPHELEIQDVKNRLSEGGDVSVLERIAYYGSMPMRWLMDTKPGKWLERASLSGVRTIFHDPTYGEETKDTTGSPTADKLADVLGSMAGAVWTMGQAGPVGGGASSLITSLGITNPVLRSVVSGVGTAATMHGLHTLSAPEEYRPKVKDFLKRATWLSSAGALTPGMQNIYDRFAGQTGFNKVLFHPVVRAGLVGIPVGGAGSALSQAVTGFEDTDSLSDFLKKTSKDALTYGGFKAISELPGTVMGRDKARAVDIYNRALDAKQRYIRGVNVIDDDTIDPNPEQIKKAVLDYGRATMEAYPIYMRRAPAGTKLTPEEHLRNNLVADISPLAHDIPADLTGESSVKWLGDALWSRASHTNFMAEEPPSPDMLALPFYEHEPAVESPVAVSSEITKSVTLGEKLISTLKVYEEAKDAQDKEQALILFAGIGQELKAIMNRMRDTAGEESWGPFLASMEKLGVSPEQMGDILQKHEELIHEIEKHEKVYSHEDLLQELRQQSQERPVVEGEDTQPKFYTREDLIRQLQMKSDESEPEEVVEEKLAPLKEDNIEQYNQSLRSLWGAAREKGLTDEETRVFFTLHTQKDSMQDAVVSDFKRVIDLLNSPKVDAKSVAQSYLKTRKKETAAEDDEVPKVEEAVSKDGLITPEDPDNIPPGTMISDIHGGDFEVVEENPNNYLVKDTKGNQRRIPKTMIRFKDSEPDMGEGAEVSEPPKTQPPSSGEPIALGMEEPEGDAEETEEVGPTPPEETEETSDNLQFLAKYGKAYEKAIDLGYKLDKMSVVDPSTGNVLFRPEEHLKIQKFHDGREFEIIDTDKQLEGLMDFLDNETQVHSIGEATTTEIEIEEPVALGTEKTKTDTAETKEDTIDIAEEPSGESRPPKKTSLKPGFKKVGMKAGSQPTAILYNPETRERLEIILSDSEYSHNEFLKWFTSYTPEVLEQVRRMPIDEDSVEAMRVHSGSILKKGDEVIVVDGQTLPIGTKAKVVDVWEHRIKGARSDVEYVTLDNGKKIKALNLKIVGSDGAKRALADKGFDEYGNPLRGEGQEGLVVPTDIDSLKRGDTVFDPHGKEFNIVRVNKLSFRVKDTAGKETTIAKSVARVKTEEPVETEEPAEIVSDTTLEAEPETKVGTSDSQIVIRVGDRGRAVRDVAENKVQLFLNDDNDLWKHQSYQSYKLEFNQETGAWERELSDEAEETVKSLTGGFRWDDDESIGQIDRDYLIEQTRKAIADNRSAIETTWLGRLILPGTSARYARDVGKMYVMMLDGQITQEEYDEFIADTKKSFGIETEEVEPVEEATTTEIEIEEPAEAVGVEEPEVITPSERPQIITKNRAEATIEELAADYKARGLDHSEAWNQLVRDRNMNPQINNREFQEIYRTVSPEPFRDASIAGDTTPTHRLVETIGREKNVAIIEDNEHYVLWVDDTGGTGSTPRTMIKSLEPLTETEPGQSLQPDKEELTPIYKSDAGQTSPFEKSSYRIEYYTTGPVNRLVADTVEAYSEEEARDIFHRRNRQSNIRNVKKLEPRSVEKSVAEELTPERIKEITSAATKPVDVEKEDTPRPSIKEDVKEQQTKLKERPLIQPGKYYIQHHDDNTYRFYSVQGYKVVLPALKDLDLFAHRTIDRNGEVLKTWTISEGSTGMDAIPGGPFKTRKAAIGELKRLIDSGEMKPEKWFNAIAGAHKRFALTPRYFSYKEGQGYDGKLIEISEPQKPEKPTKQPTKQLSVQEQAYSKAKFTRGTVDVEHRNGTFHEEEGLIYKGLAVLGESGNYNITHVNTGRWILPEVDGYANARRATYRLAEAIDWDSFTSVKQMMEVKDQIRPYVSAIEEGLELGMIWYPFPEELPSIPVSELLEKLGKVPSLHNHDDHFNARLLGEKILPGVSISDAKEVGINYALLQRGRLTEDEWEEFLEGVIDDPRYADLNLEARSPEDESAATLALETVDEPIDTQFDEEEALQKIVGKYNLQNVFDAAEEEGAVDTLAALLKGLNDLQEYDESFGEELAAEIQKLYSDSPAESIFHDQTQEEISSWVNRYTRLVDKIAELGRDITSAEAKEASNRESKIDLQLFASKGGGEIYDWKQAIQRAQSARGADIAKADAERRLPQDEDAGTQDAGGEEPPRTLEAPADDSEKEERPPAQVFIQRQKQPEGLEGAELEDWERQENERMRKGRDSRLVVRDTWDGELKAVYKDEAVAEINKKIQKSHGTAKHVMQQLKEMDSEIASPKPSLAKKFLDHGSLSAELLIDIIQGASEGPVRKYLFEEIDMGVNQKYHVERLFKEGLTDIVQKVGPKTLRTWSKFLSKKGKDAIPIKIPLSDGKSISLTRDERMELYAHYQNEEWNRANLLDGGFCFYDNQGAIHKLSEDDIQTIISTITPQEKEIVDKVVLDLLIPLAQEFGNPVAQVLWGHNLTQHAWYFPILHPETTYEQDPGMTKQDDFTRALERLSFTQARTAKNKPLIIRGFFRSILTYGNQFSDFAGLAIPVHNAQGILADTEFVNQMYNSGFENELEVIENYVNDVAGNFRNYDMLEALGDRLLKNISLSYISMNIGTMLKQPISLVLAGTEIDVGTNIVKAMKNYKAGIKEAMEKSPKMWKRSLGYVTPEMGVLADSNEMIRVFEGKNKFSDVLTKGMRKTDLFAIGTIWNLTKDHVTKHYPELEGDEYYDKVIKVFDRVNNRSQPTTEAHTKSSIGRSKNYAVRGATLFSNQKNKNYNIVRRAWWEYSTSEKTMADKNKLLKALALVGIVTSGMSVAVDRLRDLITGKRAKKDAGETILDIVEYAAGAIYGGADVINIARSMAKKGAYRGYRFEDPVLETLNKGIRGGMGIYEAVGQLHRDEKYVSGYKKDEDKWDTTLRRAVDDTLSVIAAVKGLPYDTTKRYAQGLTYHLGGEEALFEFDALTRNPQSTYYYDQLWNALEHGDEKRAKDAIKVLRSKFKVRWSDVTSSWKSRGLSKTLRDKANRLF